MIKSGGGSVSSVLADERVATRSGARTRVILIAQSIFDERGFFADSLLILCGKCCHTLFVVRCY
jgi:hypothetical protein